jgi:1-acyl-sn-glycerol-3-phosphate acyltransferase
VNINIVARTLVSRVLLLLLMIIYAIPIIIFMLMPPGMRARSRFVFWSVHIFYWLFLKCSLLPVIYQGAENMPTGQLIFVANHQSSFDIPLLGLLARGRPHVWLASSTLMTSPILRCVIPLFSVLVDLSTARKAMVSLRQILHIVSTTKQHVMLFPEGGRYVDGEVHAFLGGFVILAKKTGLPVVPVYIGGIGRVYPPNSFWVHKYPVQIVVGSPFVYGQEDTDDTFKQRVYAWFVEQNTRQKIYDSVRT